MQNKKTMLSAMAPSNRLTLGNYLGALKNWVQLQSQYDCLFFAVDLHAITVRQDPKVLREQTLRAVAYYIAGGIDPDHSLLFVQSQVPEHVELAWILTCHTYMGELSRMTQYKDKSAKEGANIGAGLFTYPALMAADILLYGTHLVPVGEDQKQHIEITRDLAVRMNHLYDPTLFVMPEPFISPVGARVMSLQNPIAKMSKSDPDQNGAVYLSDSNSEILKKVKRAVTDSGSEIRFDEEQKPGVSNLLTIQSAITGKPVTEIVDSYAGKQYGHLKVDTAEMIAACLGPIRDRANALFDEKSELEKILARGALRARARAAETLKRVRDSIGLYSP